MAFAGHSATAPSPELIGTRLAYFWEAIVDDCENCRREAGVLKFAKRKPVKQARVSVWASPLASSGFATEGSVQ
jgi:hypothetical protein